MYGQRRKIYNATLANEKQEYETLGKGEYFLNQIKALNRDETAQNIVAKLSNLP
jgi:hypothetical protein